MKPIIDAHLDLAWNALGWKRDITRSLGDLNRLDAHLSDVRARGRATTTLPEMRRGRIAVCLGTLLVRTSEVPRDIVFADSLDYPSQDAAHAAARGQLAYYQQLERRGELRLLKSSSDLEDHWKSWTDGFAADDAAEKLPIGLIVAMEGSDGISEPAEAEYWYEKGLRCASLVHYGHSVYAAGTGVDGPLTPRGRELLKEFDRLGIILDTTHLCDPSFFEALDSYQGPVIASHNNCRALVPHQRQFSDEQLGRIIERDGIIGLAFDAWMLKPGWQRGTSDRKNVGIEAAADHLDHICQLAGSAKNVAIGSDLDGGFGTEQTPTGLDSIADLQKLSNIFRSRGYSDEDIDRVFHRNWLDFFTKHLP